MNISSVKNINPNFRHKHSSADNKYPAKDRLIVAGTTALGVATSLAILAKNAKTPKGKNYSLNPIKMFIVAC